MSWFTLQSLKKHEQIAARHLSAMGIEVFAPRIRFERLSRHGARGKVWVTEALFPGYLFAQFEHPSCHRAVQASPGVSKIVKFGSVIPVIPEEIIAELKRIVGDELQLGQVAELGNGVRLAGGVWSGIEGLVTGIHEGKHRVKVLIEFLGRLIETDVAREALLLPISHPMQKG